MIRTVKLQVEEKIYILEESGGFTDFEMTYGLQVERHNKTNDTHGPKRNYSE